MVNPIAGTNMIMTNPSFRSGGKLMFTGECINLDLTLAPHLYLFFAIRRLATKLIDLSHDVVTNILVKWFLLNGLNFINKKRKEKE